MRGYLSPEAQSAGFGRMSTEQPPLSYPLNLTEDVRMRCSGHGRVLLDYGGFTVMTDPVAGYDRDGAAPQPHLADLPRLIDVLVLNSGQRDHLCLETLLQLRRRIGVIVVPRTSARGVAHIGPRVLLKRLGFTEVLELEDTRSVEIGPARINTLPCLTRHGESDGHARTAPLVRLGGRAFLFTADNSPLTGAAHDLVRQEVGWVDALFTGSEHPVCGSDCHTAASADPLAEQVGARETFVHAPGAETWLRYPAGPGDDRGDEAPEREAEPGRLAGGSDVPSPLFRVTAERSWPVQDPAT